MKVDVSPFERNGDDGRNAREASGTVILIQVQCMCNFSRNRRKTSVWRTRHQTPKLFSSTVRLRAALRPARRSSRRRTSPGPSRDRADLAGLSAPWYARDPTRTRRVCLPRPPRSARESDTLDHPTRRLPLHARRGTAPRSWRRPSTVTSPTVSGTTAWRTSATRATPTPCCRRCTSADRSEKGSWSTTSAFPRRTKRTC